MTTQTLNPVGAPSAVPNILADRADFRAIARWIEPNSTVLDLGCADGSLRWRALGPCPCSVNR